MITRHYYRPGFLPTGFTEAPISRLLSLPREIRDEIVVHLLRAGDLAILRTSRQIYRESKERLYREGIFRFKIGFADRSRGICLPNVWIKFQSLHLDIFVGGADKERMPYAARLQLELLRLLDETYPEVIYPKRECHIVFDFGIVDLESEDTLNTCNMYTALPLLAPLVAFTTVVISFVPGQSGLWQVEGTLVGNWEIVSRYLERRLGPYKIIRGTDEEEERMVFHPLEWCNSLTQTEQITEP